MKTNSPVKKMMLLSVAIALSACTAQKIATVRENYTNIPDSEKNIDIPTYDSAHWLAGYPYNYWHYTKQKEEQLGLPQLETSDLDQVFRVWITNPGRKKGQTHGLIRIVCDADSCFGELILMRVNFKRKTIAEEITESKTIPLSPSKFTWQEITDSLIQLQFDELPTDDEIPNYYGRNEGYMNRGPTYSFEYSTPAEYRFYQYNDLYRAKDRFWQPQNVLKIFELLEAEFRWDTRAREYFQ